MLRSTKMLVLLAVIACLAAASMPAFAGWSLYNDFSSVTNGGTNPWSYGQSPVYMSWDYSHSPYVWSDNGSYAFTPFTTAMVPDAGWGGYWVTSPAWVGTGASHDDAPTAFIRKFTGTAIWDLLPQTVNMYPGFAAGGGTTGSAVVRWTAPSAGNYLVNLTANPFSTSNHAPDFNIRKNNANLVADFIFTGNYAYNEVLSLSANDTLDFVVGSGGDAYSGYRTVGLSVDIADASVTTTISGTVTSSTGAHGPVGGVSVTTTGTDATPYASSTDSTGFYSITVPKGPTYSVAYSKAQWVSQSQSVVANAANKTQNVVLVPWGTVSGVVSGGGSPVSGALVKDTGGLSTFTTGADGVYTLTLAAGTYTIQASNYNYQTAQVANVVVADGTNITQNISLAALPMISGTVTDSVSLAALQGVAIAVSDGMHFATTDVTGHYSVPVPVGADTLIYKRMGFLPKKIALTVSVSTNQNVALDHGWDLATDFASQSWRNYWQNPLSGIWSYAYSDGTTSNLIPYHANSGYDAYSEYYGLRRWYLTGYPFRSPDFSLNTGSPVSTSWEYNDSYIESGALVSDGGIPSPDDGTRLRSVARFTAPDGGYFRITARWGGAKFDSSGSTNNVGLKVNGAWAFGADSGTAIQQLNGFQGRSASGYADSFGAKPVIIYSADLDIPYGTNIDVVNWGSDTPAQTDLTIAPLSTQIKGRVTCNNLAGNPPVVGATVMAVRDGGGSYQTATDINGYYMLSVRGGDFEMSVSKSGFGGPGNFAVISVSDDTVSTQNFTMPHTDTWDLASDFSPNVNPNGQWSYGFAGYQNGTQETASFGLYTAPQTFLSTNPRTGWGKGSVTFEYFGDPCSDPGPGWIWKNLSGKNVLNNWWWGSPAQFLPTWFVEDQHVSLGGGDAWNGSAPTVRWTAPDRRIIDVNLTLKGQNVHGGTVPIRIFKNGNLLAGRTVDGFVGFAGTWANNYTDSIATVGTAPVATFASTLVVTTGDTLDFLPYIGGSPWPCVDISLIISRNSTIVQCNTINDLKDQPLNTQVMLMTPMAIVAGVNRYGSSHNFYIESADRSQAVKLVGDASTPVVAEGTKVTFAGKVVADPDDPSRNVIQIVSINDQVAGTELKPLGATGKAITTAAPTLRDKLVRVCGKVISVVANTGSDSDKWPYEYYVINDGSGDIKVKMHGQSTWMTDPVPLNAATPGHFIAVTGIVFKTSTDTYIFPRGYGSGINDLDDYWSNQPH